MRVYIIRYFNNIYERLNDRTGMACDKFCAGHSRITLCCVGTIWALCDILLFVVLVNSLSTDYTYILRITECNVRVYEYLPLRLSNNRGMLTACIFNIIIQRLICRDRMQSYTFMLYIYM